MRGERSAVTAVAVAGMLLLTGCAGGDPAPVPTPTHVDLATFPPGEPAGNGVEHLSGADILRAAIAAIDGQAGMSFTLDYRDARGRATVEFRGRVGAAAARIETADGTLDLVLGPDAGTAAGTGTLAASYGLDDSPACLPPTHPVFGDRALFLDPGALLRALTARVTLARGGVTPGDPPTVDVILDAGSGTAGTLAVAASGPALPVRLVLADESGSADLVVTGWDAADLDIPAGC